jgi:phthalate 4,5-cis-dihydrodiol dehydrogenase
VIPSGSEKILDVALIGCGEHARVDLLPCLLQIPGIRLVAACDPDEVNAAAVMSLVEGSIGYQGYRELFESRLPLDAVVVVAPPQIHTAAAQVALSRGIHVFTEKPPAVTTSELIRIADLGLSSGRVTAVGHNLRYSSAFAVLLDLVREDPPLSFDVRYLTSGPRGDRWGLGSPTRSFLLSHVIHVVDLVLCALGAPQSISASAVRSSNGNGVLVSAHLGFGGRHLSSIVVGDMASSFHLDAWAISQGGCSIHLDSLRSVRCFGPCVRGKRWSEEWRPRTLESGYVVSGYLGELHSFFNGISSSHGTRPSFQEEILTYQVIDEIEAQIEKGK